MTVHAARLVIAERVRAAAAAGERLSIRGGGSKAFLGEPAQGEPLDTRGLSGVLLYEPSELVIKAGGGTPLAQVEAVLAEHGQCLPFEPPRFEGATLGGMVAAGLSGPARASVGSVRDYVLGASLVNGRGEDLHFGGEVMKNVAGYDVARLLAGSMGTLGVIADVSLKVLPVATAQATLAFDCTQADALRLLNGWGGQPLPLNASRWLPGDAGADGVLWLRLRGARAAVTAACRQLGGTLVDAAVADAAWSDWRDLRDASFVPRAGQALWRLSVPQTAPVLQLPGPVCLDWHGAQRWLRADPSEAPRIRAAVQAVHGHATLLRAADGPTPGEPPPRFDRIEPTLLRIQKDLMQAFDPEGVFDRRRLLADA